MTGISLFLNKTGRDYDCKIKCNISDFIVQEITNDKICGVNHIFNIDKYFDSIDLLYYMSKNHDLNNLKIYEEIKFKEYQGDLDKCVKSFEDFLCENNFTEYKKLINGLNINRITEIKKKQEFLNSITEIAAKVSCKSKRSDLHKILHYNPFYTACTKDNNIIIKKDLSTTSIYTVTLEKIMFNTVNACKYLSNEVGVHHSRINFAGNKDKRGITFQEISIQGDFMKILDFAYQNEDFSISNYFETEFENEVTNLGKEKKLKEIKVSKKKDVLNQILLLYINDKTISYDYLNVINEDINTLEDLEKGISSPQDNNYEGNDHVKSKIRIYDIRKSNNKKLGDLIGNKFTIKIYNVNNPNLEVLEKGFINYFGPQRFGKNLNNHIVGEQILSKQYSEAIESILKNSKGYSVYREVMDNYESIDTEIGDCYSLFEDKIQKCLSLCDNSERYLMKQKFRKISDKKIILGLKREIRMLYLHAFQSYRFNLSVNERLKAGFEIQEGDLVEDNGIQVVSRDNIYKYTIYDLVLPLEKMKDKMLKGGMRKVIETCFDVSGRNEGNDYIVSFMLNKSCYATVALRELVGDSILMH